MKKNIKLLALDFDGTILDSAKHFPQETVAALHELAQNGVKIAAATGRCMPEFADYEQEMADFHYGIISNGGLVYDFRAKKNICLYNIDLADALQLIAAAKEEDTMLHIHTPDASTVPQDFLPRISQFHKEPYREMFERTSQSVEDIEAFVRAHAQEVIKMDIYHRDVQARARTRARLAGTKLQMVDTEICSLEFCAPEVSKGYGLQALCEHLKLPLAECAAIGDALNDLEILQAAGFGIAMGNAPESVKAVCAAVTADSEHNGVLQAIKQYFL